MTQNGKITTVAIVRAGSALQTAAAISDAVIYVDDACDFIETGGSLEIDGVTYAYTAVNMDTDAITLTTGLTSVFDIGQPVFAMPSSYEKRASVTLSDGGDTTEARVPHNLYDRIPEGIREDFAQESVTLDIVNEEWTIVDVIGKEPSIDGSFLDPNTVPATSTDGVPPGFSPVLTAIGSIGAVFLRWPAIANADPVLYAVHMSTTDNFNADSTTLLSVTPGATLSVRTLPDNSALIYGVTYYFRVIATDADGAAEPSAAVSAQMMQVTGPDIAANYGYFGQIVADQITGGTLSADVTLSSTIKTAATGARAELSALGLLITDSTGAPTTILGTNGENYFKGNVEANGLTVNGGATFRSTTNELSRAAVWTLASGVTASTNAPSVVVDWEKTPLKDSTGATWPTPGNLRGLHLTLSGKWMSADTAGAVHQWNADGTHYSTLTTTTGLTHAVQPVSGGAIYGMRVSGATAYISRLTEETVFSDDFSGTLAGWPLNSVIGTGTVTTSSGRARLLVPPASEATLRRALEGNFKTRAVQAKVDLSALASGAGFVMGVDSTVENTSFLMIVENGELVWQTVMDGSALQESIVFNPVAHAYWRIAEFKNAVVYQVSPDGVTWTTLGTVTHGRPTTAFAGMEWYFWSYASSFSTNKISNPTFESNADNWFLATSLTELHRSSAQAHSGTWSMWVVPTAGNTGMLSVRSNVIAINPGNSIDIAAWVKAAAGGVSPNDQGAIVAKWYDGIGTLLSSTTVATVASNSGTWTQVSGTAIAPALSSQVRIELQSSDSSGSGAEAFWDDVSVFLTGTNVTYSAYVDDARYFKSIGSIPYTRINTAQSPALGIAFGGLLVAEYDAPNTRFSVRRVDAENMSTIISTLTTPSNAAFSGTLAGIMRGTFDYAEDRYILSASGAAGTNWWSFKTSDGSYQSTDNFPVITGGNQGIGWDGTNFWGLGSDGNLYKHTNIKWVSGTDSAAWSAGFTWYDGGTQESGVSPYAAFTMKMRARLTVTSSAIPYTGVGDPDRIRVYVGRGAGSKYRQATSAATVNTVTLTTATFSGTVAPTVSTFLTATPAKIRNSDDSLIISADGTISLGGKQVSAGIPTVTVLQTTGTWTKPAFLKWAMVEVIGSGGGGGGPTGGGSQSEGACGGGGGYTKKFYLASDLSATEAYTVGAAGTGGVAGGNGVAGGTVTFKGLSATGGGGGNGMPAVGATADNVATGGSGGVGSGGDVNLPGESGGKARVLQGKATLTARGGSSGNGMGAGGVPPTSVGVGSAGTGYGGGGGGSFGTAAGANGGAGSKGALIITCYF